MVFFAFIAFGVFVGLFAQWFVPASNANIVMDVVVGAIGSAIGGWLYVVWQHSGTTTVNVPSFVAAAVGACLLLWVTRTLGAGGAR